METRLKELSGCLGSWTSVGVSSISLVQLVVSSLSSIQLTGAGRLAHSAGNSWRPAQSSERCILVRIRVDESGTVIGRADGPERGRNRQWAVMGRLWGGFGKKESDP
ncbi:hypothetical protein F2Q69_00021635 [Brassica cretica]|uniref:Uncharacterized protein n=1 Tax=Brassica cretica TaxID=69181 RepID=A0A8S9QBV3_BRACR|nr:hypothetical protein F2Q69_00021635 [Brassica cretica]